MVWPEVGTVFHVPPTSHLYSTPVPISVCVSLSVLFSLSPWLYLCFYFYVWFYLCLWVYFLSVSFCVYVSVYFSVSILFSIYVILFPSLPLSIFLLQLPSSLSLSPSPSPSLPPPPPLSIPPPSLPSPQILYLSLLPSLVLSAPLRHLPLPVPVGLVSAKEGPAASWTGSFSSCGITKPSPAQPRLLDLRLVPCPAENGRPIYTETSARTGEEMPHLTQPYGEDWGVSTSQNPSLETF